MTRLILIAHDAKKEAMVEWIRRRRNDFPGVELFATRATGEEIVAETGMEVRLLPDGPDGEEAMLGMIEDGRVDLVVFFWDPRSPQPAEIDADRLVRMAYDCDISTALNPWTADYFLDLLCDGKPKRRKKIAI